MKSAGKARNNGLYRHIRTSKEIIRNLLNDSSENGGNEKGIKDIVQNTQNDSRHKITGSYKISRRMLKSYSPYLATMNDDEIASILKAALTLYFESHPLENSEQRGYNISEEAV